MREEVLNIDVYKKTYTKQILKQYDTTRLIVGLYERSKPYDLQDKTFKYIFRRIDGSIVRDEGIVEDSRVVFDLDEICLQLSGQSEFEIQIYENEELISSFIIPIEVEPSNMNNAEAVDKGLYLQDIDKTYQKMKTEIVEFEEAEEERAAAETQREELSERMAEDTEAIEELTQTIQTKLDNGEFNGQPNVLTIGSVTSGDTASAEILGDSPNQTLNLVLPKGDSGTTDYTEMTNKPKINNVELDGNKTNEDLNIQDKLISGQNIKTINNQPILGSGNINIEGGGQGGGLSSVAHDNTMTGTGTSENPLKVDTNRIAQKSDIPDTSNFITKSVNNLENYTKTNDLGNLATKDTVNYETEVINKPTIPSEVTEQTVADWGFTKNTGTYSKPSGGIPKNDLSSDVQTSLGKADTALQSYTEQYTGTITGVTMNGVSKGTSGVVDLGTVITSHQDLSNYELKPTTVSSSETTASITPQNNTIYQFGELTSLTITNPPATGAYSIIFTSGATATTTVIPNTMLGLEDFAAEANTVYEINVFNNRAVVGSWAVSV